MVTVTERVPLVVGLSPFNEGYLETKRDRMGHEIVARELDHQPAGGPAEPIAEGATR